MAYVLITDDSLVQRKIISTRGNDPVFHTIYNRGIPGLDRDDIFAFDILVEIIGISSSFLSDTVIRPFKLDPVSGNGISSLLFFLKDDLS